jgi:hypothetical protein
MWKCNAPAPPGLVVKSGSLGAGSVSQVALAQTPSGLRSTRRKTAKVVWGIASWTFTMPRTSKVPGPLRSAAVVATFTMPAPRPLTAVNGLSVLAVASAWTLIASGVAVGKPLLF